MQCIADAVKSAIAHVMLCVSAVALCVIVGLWAGGDWEPEIAEHNISIVTHRSADQVVAISCWRNGQQVACWLDDDLVRFDEPPVPAVIYGAGLEEAQR